MCEVDVTLVINGENRRARMRWVRERPDDEVAFPNMRVSGSLWCGDRWQCSAVLSGVTPPTDDPLECSNVCDGITTTV
jgi:hypothetical protein